MTATPPPAALKPMRAEYRQHAAKLESDRRKRTNPVFEQYDKVLATNQNTLTQQKRLDEALLLQQRRDALTEAWLNSASPNPSPLVPNSKGAALPTKERPFVNSLGMKFVPVPGTKVFFSIWETRVQDYADFARVNKVSNSWQRQVLHGVIVKGEAQHPVLGVTWDEAKWFCRWLTEREAKRGKLPKGAIYRLPADEEWSRAVGLAFEPGATPEEKSGKNDADFPWGKDFPPKAKVGNLADEALYKDFPQQQRIVGYTDGFATTAPVGSFPANEFGIFDLEGNAREWCEDWFNASQKERVLRGGHWLAIGRERLLSSARNRFNPSDHFSNSFQGFRCVLEFAP